LPPPVREDPFISGHQKVKMIEEEEWEKKGIRKGMTILNCIDGRTPRTVES